jgi:CRISPR-associated exonuclease Cas4
MFAEEDLLPLSGLQHFVFCARQAALIHLEQTWADDARTVEGTRLHARVHAGDREASDEVWVTRGLHLRSLRLGLVGKADVVEFHRVRQGEEGASLPRVPGRWRPFPVEYKRGQPKSHRADEIQLCAQALCLEEMLGVPVVAGALFYGRTRRRVAVAFDTDLRSLTEDAALRFRRMIAAGATPPPEFGPKCRRCSLLERCQPRVAGRTTTRYLHTLFREATPPAESPP